MLVFIIFLIKKYVAYNSIESLTSFCQTIDEVIKELEENTITILDKKKANLLAEIEDVQNTKDILIKKRLESFVIDPQ